MSCFGTLASFTCADGRLEAHQVLGQDAIGADFNSLAHIFRRICLFRCIESLRRSPELKEVFSSAAAAAKTVPKEQAAAVASEVKAFDKVQAQLATFRVK